MKTELKGSMKSLVGYDLVQFFFGSKLFETSSNFLNQYKIFEPVLNFLNQNEIF